MNKIANIEQLESRTLFSADVISSLPLISSPTYDRVVYIGPVLNVAAVAPIKIGAVWTNTTIPTEKVPFTLDFDAVPSKAGCDTVLGISGVKAKAYSQLAAMVRFNNGNTIDVRNGGVYTADQTLSYVAGTNYHVRFVVNPTQHTYSVYVTPQGGSQVILASNYAFRTEQSSLTTINNFAGYSSTGSVSVYNLASNIISSIPTAPVGLTAVPNSSSQITLSWGNSAGSNSTTILKSTDGINFTVLTTVGSGVNTFADVGLTASTVYYYEAYNSNSLGSSPTTASVTATTLAVVLPPPPPSGTEPGPTNTGPTVTALQPMGGMTITTAGTVLDGVSITGTVVIKAANVTIKNFRINANGNTYGVQVVSGNVILEDGEITNAMGGAVFGNNWTALRLNVHQMGSDAFDGGGNNTLQDCWIHDIGMSPGAHADGIQLNNGDHIVIAGNNFDLPWWNQIGSQVYRVNSCIFMNGYVYNYLDGTVIDHNWLNGGNYSIYALGQTNTVVTNNIFGQDYQYGYVDGSVSVWANNVDSSGKSV
jgi:hypothetical protein